MRCGPGWPYGVRAQRNGGIARAASTLRGAAVLVLTGAVPAAGSAQQRTTAPPSLVFDGATVVDVEQGKLLLAQRVVIRGNRIEAMGKADVVKLPRGAQIVDARGKYLMPGLWDMHTHAMRSTDFFYPLFLANGVTGIRDAASPVPLDTLILWRREILAGTRVGPPRQMLSGKAIDQVPSCTPAKTSPHACAPDLPDEAPPTSSDPQQAMIQAALAALNNGLGQASSGDTTCTRAGYQGSTGDDPHHTCVTDSADARHLVDSLRAAGADMIKTYRLSRAMYFVVAAEARRLGVPFGGHVDWATAIEASDSGASLLDHLSSSGDLAGRCVPTAEPSAVTQKTPNGFQVQLRHTVVRRYARMSVVSEPNVERCRAVAERFIRNGTWWVPTLVAIGNFDIVGPYTKAIVDRLTEYSRKFLQDSVLNPYSRNHTGGAPPYAVHGAPDSLAVLRIIREVGLPVVAGTDAGWMPNQLAGFSLHAELATYVAEGLTPLEALRSATLNPAKMLHATDSLGTVAPGKLADLVLLDADPLADITNTTTIRAVVANGRYFDRAALDSALAEGHRAVAKEGKTAGAP